MVKKFRNVTKAFAGTGKKTKQKAVSIWRWFERQAAPLQVLLAILALLVAIAGIVVPLTAGGSSGSSATGNNSKPQKPAIKLPKTPELLVSSNGEGEAANGDSGRPAFSASGRYVIFTSAATNLVTAKFPAGYGYHNIYLKDRETGIVYWVSAGVGDEPPDGESQFPAICPTGRFVAFSSEATNLIQGGPQLVGPKWRVYVYDRINNETYLISVNTNGQDSDGDSYDPQFNSDCSSVAFESTSDDLVKGDTNSATDVFVRRLSEKKTELVSEDGHGPLNNASYNPAISPSGALIAFTSYATNLPGASVGEPSVYIVDTITGNVTNVSAPFDALATTDKGFSWASFSPDGRYLVFRSLEDDTTEMGGPAVLVWNTKSNHSALLDINGNPTGWTDACTIGVNNGTNFSPSVSDPGPGHSYLVMFTVIKKGTCQLVLRDFSDSDIPISLSNGDKEVLEPALDALGDVIAYDVAGEPQLVYACTIEACSRSSG